VIVIKAISKINKIDDNFLANCWKITFRKYDYNHKLDFNYAKFSSLDSSFEVIRNHGKYGYSKPKIINIC
jgi:hypothetical protein